MERRPILNYKGVCQTTSLDNQTIVLFSWPISILKVFLTPINVARFETLDPLEREHLWLLTKRPLFEQSFGRFILISLLRTPLNAPATPSLSR